MLSIVFNFAPANFFAVLQYYVSFFAVLQYYVTHEQLTLKNSYMLRRNSDTQRGQQLRASMRKWLDTHDIKEGRVEE